VFLEEGAGDFAGFEEGGAGDEDEAELGGHGFLGNIVVDLRKEDGLTHRRGGRRGEEDKEEEEEEVLWRWIVRAHPLQNAQRVGHPQVRVFGGVTKSTARNGCATGGRRTLRGNAQGKKPPLHLRLGSG
jgi:hypothetical protein